MSNQPKPRGRPRSQFSESTAGTLQSLDRALGVLVVLAREERSSLTNLALALGIPAPTTHRILMTLLKHGFVEFNDERQLWMIGVEAYRTGASFLKRNGLIEIGQPIMRRLMEETGETANLAVADQGNVVFIGQVETSNPVRAFFPPGTRTSMHASGTGKAILAAMPRVRVEKMLKKVGLTSFTDSTIVSPDAFFDDLEATKARGWSHDHEERFSGMSCVGAAIFDDTGEPCGGISVSGPSVRFTDKRVAVFGIAVAKAAEQITLQSGGRFVRE